MTGADTVTLPRPLERALRRRGREGLSGRSRVGRPRGEAAAFDVTDWGDGILTLRSQASGPC